MSHAETPTDAEETMIFDQWLHDFDVKLAALDARQDALLRRLGVRAAEDKEAA